MTGTAPASAPGPTEAPARPKARRRRRAWGRAGFWFAVIGLLALNAWRIVRDFQPAPNLREANRLLARGQADEAATILRRYLARSPLDGDARMDLARVLAADGDLLGCARQLDRVPAWWPRKGEASFLAGNAYMQISHAGEAERALLVAVRDDPLHPTPPALHKAATEQLIELYALEARWPDAQDVIWETFDRVGPEDRPNVLIMLARTEVERISDAGAEPRLQRILEVDPDDFDARLALASVEQALGHIDESNRLFSSCLADRPESLPTWRAWLKALRDRGDRAGMTRAVEALPAEADGDAALWGYRGMVAEWRRDFAGAAEAYRRSVALDDHDEAILYRLSQAERRLGHFDAAKAALARSREVRAARDDLLESLYAYNDAATPGQPAGPEMADETERLASHCATLGWTRLAEALRSLVPKPKASG